MTFEPETYRDLPDPAHDPEAADACMEYAADHDPDSDAEIAIGAALDRATKGWKDAQTALSEARTYGVAANHAAYNGPVSAARYAATACDRAAGRATVAWQAAYEAADDAGSIAHADPDAAGSARQAAEGATVCARMARRAAHDARLDAEKAERNTEARSDQRAPAPTLEADPINALLLEAHAAFTGLAASGSDEEARGVFAERRDRAARLLHERGAWPYAAPWAEAERLAEEPDPEPQTVPCEACDEPCLPGVGVCHECEKAEAEKGQG